MKEDSPLMRTFSFSSEIDKICAFIDDDYSGVMVKVASIGDGFVDPVELTSKHARMLAQALIELSDLLDREAR